MTQELDFFCQSQRPQKNWCWAAVAASVFNYYNRNQSLTACILASDILQRYGCCQNPSFCDLQHDLARALKYNDNLDGSPIRGAISFERCYDQIVTYKKPICAYIQWHGSGAGHFVVISGVNKQSFLNLKIHDPLGDIIYINYEIFCARYKNSGSWIYTYLTK
jgi:hypothetical protein